MEDDSETFKLRGKLSGHSDWVTCMAIGQTPDTADVLVSGSRDKTLMIWKLDRACDDKNVTKYGMAHKSLTGHNHFISDISLSQEGNFLISSSWDKTLRLWDMKKLKTTRRFIGHTKEVFSVSFSSDNRQIISSGADKSIKLWNTIAECKFTSDTNNHTDWVSCLRYCPLKSPTSKTVQNYFTSVGWDGRLKIWNTNFQIRYSFKAHEGNINTVAISPNRNYVATGGKDKNMHMWDLNNLEAPLRSFECGAPINQIAFNPQYQFVCAGTDNGIKIYNLGGEDSKEKKGEVIQEITHYNEKEGESKKKRKPVPCTALAIDADRLYGGFADGVIKVWDFNIRK